MDQDAEVGRAGTRPFFFSLQKGKPVFHSNFCDLTHYEIAGTKALAPGKHTVGMDFAYDGGGIGGAVP